LRLNFLKGANKFAAGTPSRFNVNMNQFQIPQWEKVKEKTFDKTSRIASAQGGHLRLPIYRVKTVANLNNPNG